jgi:predicted  nucleic acid-binding Zn-ribbon protein
MKGRIIKGSISIILLYLIYLGYSLFQENTSKYNHLENSIDSLSGEITKLDSIHVKQDSIIVLYKDSIVYLDNVIEKEKTKYIQIKHKFDEKRTHIVHYTPNQLDSFFSKRYGQFESNFIVPNR